MTRPAAIPTVQIDTARPDLSLMDAANTLAKALQLLLFGENSPRARAKALEDFIGLRGVEQDDALDLGPERTHLPQHLGAAARLVIQGITDDHDVDGDSSDGGQQLCGVRGRGYDLQAAIVA